MVYGSGLILKGELAGYTGDFGGGNILPQLIPGIDLTDSLLELCRRSCVDGQNFRKPQLTDHIRKLIFPVAAAWFSRKHGHSSFVRFLHYSLAMHKWQGKSLVEHGKKL